MVYNWKLDSRSVIMDWVSYLLYIDLDSHDLETISFVAMHKEQLEFARLMGEFYELEPDDFRFLYDSSSARSYSFRVFFSSDDIALKFKLFIGFH